MSTTRRVIFLLSPKVHLLDLAGPAQVFDAATGCGAPYHLEFCSPFAEVQSAQGLVLRADGALPRAGVGDLLVIAGMRARETPRTAPPDVRQWLQDAHAAGAELASVCSGAFFLADAGLLNGRRCTTHWSLTGELRRRLRHGEVVEAALYVRDGRITTSAGIASGIDMALSIVERDHGAAMAAQVARELVVYLRRDGLQSQDSVFVAFRNHLHPGIHRAQDWLNGRFREPFSLAELARAARMSTRSLQRAFKAATGLTPLGYQHRLRLEWAATLLRDPTMKVDAIAERCGFVDSRHFRRLWTEAFGKPPSASRLPASAVAHGAFSSRRDG